MRLTRKTSTSLFSLVLCMVASLGFALSSMAKSGDPVVVMETTKGKINNCEGMDQGVGPSSMACHFPGWDHHLARVRGLLWNIVKSLPMSHLLPIHQHVLR